MTLPAHGLIGTPAFQPGRQRAELTVYDRTQDSHRRVYACDHLIEAPNWTPDGRWLVFNSAGALFKIRADGSAAPERIDSGAHAPANNDHVLSPDGRTVYFSTDDGHILAVPLAGGAPRRVSNLYSGLGEFRCYLHGISPDGRWLAYVGLGIGMTDASGRATGSAHEPALDVDYGLYLLPTAGGPDRELLRPGVPVDGPEFSPDGAWLYFNGEIGARRPGHSQLWRLHLELGTLEQLTHDERVNWFPHLSPDGRWLLWLSYPPGTLGHPANREVILRLAEVGNAPSNPTTGPVISSSTDLVTLLGGQGTINVNGWAPDSARFAYVSYPAL